MRSNTETEAGTLILKKYGEFFKKQYQDYQKINENNVYEDNKTFSPIQVLISPNERITLTELVSSDNVIITKVLSVLASLCMEIKTLKIEAFNRLELFIEAFKRLELG